MSLWPLSHQDPSRWWNALRKEVPRYLPDFPTVLLDLLLSYLRYEPITMRVLSNLCDCLIKDARPLKVKLCVDASDNPVTVRDILLGDTVVGFIWGGEWSGTEQFAEVPYSCWTTLSGNTAVALAIADKTLPCKPDAMIVIWKQGRMGHNEVHMVHSLDVTEEQLELHASLLNDLL
jgi:hypothetical protein